MSCGINYRGKIYDNRIGSLMAKEHYRIFDELDNKELSEKRDGKLYMSKFDVPKQNRLLKKIVAINKTFPESVIKIGSDRRVTIDLRKIDHVFKDYILAEDRVKDQEINANEYIIDGEVKPSLYQLKATDELKLQDLDDKIKVWLRSAGVAVSNVDGIKDRKGNPINAIAKADFLQNIVEYVDNKSGATTLSEEAAHFLVELMGVDHPLIKKMLEDVVKRPEYAEVLEEYKNVYTDPMDFKKEAIGKMIANEALTQFRDTPHAGWWDRIKTWFKNKFNRVSAEDISDASAPYKQAAQMLLSGDVSSLTKTPAELASELHEKLSKGEELAGELYSLEYMNPDQKQIVDMLKSTKIILKNGVYVNAETKAEVKNRVSDLIERYRISMNMKSYDNPTPSYIGTVLHAYMEMIINDEVNGTGLDSRAIIAQVKAKLEGSEIPESFKTLEYKDVANLRTGAIKLLKGVAERQAAINKENNTTGTPVILTEQIIHSENNDLAGTIDLIVVYSDGSVGTFDFKSFNMTDNDLKYDNDLLSVDKYTIWNLQGTNYHEILREAYGIKKFRENRMVPIGTRSWEKGALNSRQDVTKISFALMNDGAVTKAALEHIPLSDEVTGDINIDRALKKLTALRNSLDVERRTQNFQQKKKTEVKMRTIDRSVRALRLNKDMTVISETAFNLVRKIREALTVDKGNDVRYLSPGRMAELMQELTVYENIITSSTGELNDMLTNAKDLTDAAATVNNSKNLLVLGYIQSTKQDLINLMTNRASEQAGEDLTNVGKAQGTFGRLFYGIADVDSPIFRRFTDLFTSARDAAEKDTYDAISMIKSHHSNLETWASSNGLSMIQAFDKIVNPDTKKLITEYSPEFWKDWNKAKETKDIAWLKEHMTFQEDIYLDHLRDYDSFFSDPLFDGAAYFGMRRKKNETAEVFKLRVDEKVRSERQKFIERNDVRVTSDALATAKLDILRPKPSDKYITEEFKYVMANPPLLEYYRMYTNMNEIFGKKTGSAHKIGRSFIANIAQDSIDRLTELGPIEGVSGMWRSMVHSLQVREEDALLGKTDPSTGKRIPGVPLLFSDEIRVSLSSKELADIKSRLAEQYGEGTSDYKKHLDIEVISKEYEKGRKIKSVDLTKSLILMTKAVNNYEAMSNIESDVKALRQILVEGDVEETLLDARGQSMKSNISRVMMKRLGVDGNTIQQFDDMVDFLLYGVQRKDGMMVGDKIAVDKVIDGMHKYLSIKALGLNPILGAASYIGASANLSMLAAEGRMFSKEDLSLASDSLSIGPFGRSGKSEEDRGLVSLIRASTRDLIYQEAEETAVTFASKHFTGNNMFMFHRKGDDNIDNKIALAMANSHVIDDDGLVKHKSKAKNKEAKSIRELTVVKEDGKVIVEFQGANFFKNNPDQYTAFRNRIRKVAFNVKGSMSEELRGAVHATFMGQMLMKFRSWMPGLIQTRAGSLRYDHTMEDIEMGRFRVFFGNMLANGLFPRLEFVSQTLIGLINSKYATGMIDKEYTRELMKRFFEENPHLRNTGITEEDFIKMQEAKIKGTLHEIRMVLAFALILALLSGSDWDDRDENNIFSRNAYLVIKRSFLEVSFFINPSSGMELAKYPVPVLGVVQSLLQIKTNTVDEVSDSLFGEQQINDTTGYLYYTLKATPVANQILSILAFFNPSRHETGSERLMDEKKKKRKKKEES